MADTDNNYSIYFYVDKQLVRKITGKSKAQIEARLARPTTDRLFLSKRILHVHSETVSEYVNPFPINYNEVSL